MWRRFRSLHLLVQVGARMLGALMALLILGNTFNTVDFGSADIVNDTSGSVRVWTCDSSDCRSDFPHKVTLRPGRTEDATILKGVPNVFLVLTLDAGVTTGARKEG